MSVSDIRVVPSAYLQSADTLRPALNTAIRNNETGEVFWDEIDDVVRDVEASWRPSDPRYFGVALNSGGGALGVMGLQPPGDRMFDFATTESPEEIINAYVHREARGLGVGQLLVRHLEDVAAQNGHTELLLNSGPRYEPTGWGFWRRMYGEEVGAMVDYYGPGYHAMVWRHILANPAKS